MRYAIVVLAVMSASWLTPATAAEPCAGGIGQWHWFIGGQVALSQDNKVRWTGNGSIPPASGTWKCDPKVGKFVVTWQNGFVDTLSLSPDGSKLTGMSSTGVVVSGARVGTPTGNAPTAGTAPVGPVARPVAPTRPSTSGAVDHNPSVREILQDRPKLDPGGWKQGGNRAPQKGPKPFEGWQ